MSAIAKRILELAVRKAGQAEVFLSEEERLTVEFAAGKARSVGTAQRVAVALRVIKDGRLGFYATSDLADPGDIVDRAVAAAGEGREARFAFAPQAAGPKVDVWDEKAAGLGAGDLIEMGRRLDGMITDAEPEAVVNSTYARATSLTVLANSSGQSVESRRTQVSGQILAERTRVNDVAIVRRWSAACGVDDGLERAARRAILMLERSREPATVRPGRMPVIFSPDLVYALLLPIYEGVSGRNVKMGTSPLADKVGRKIVDERLTIVDDATLAGRPASAGHDAEGVPMRRTPIIEGGVLKNLVFDLRTAGEMGVASTGHGRRYSALREPVIDMSNVVVSPGDLPLEAMLAGIKEGLYVEELIGVGNGNMSTGAFSNPVAMAFRIEDGRLRGRVKDVSVSGNAYDLLRDNLGGLEDQTVWTGNRIRAPHILLNEVSVAGKG
jgi:PmbA protein